ncbi:TPA: ABC transporter ATP-binding protein [Candidatus Ventrenecus stercoripullorum]|nr:ABC transporter ATP-binding protein [Candidatus Ventrenecus stercoripullorum]
MLKLLKGFTKKDWLTILVGIVFIVAQVWLDLKLPDYMSRITVLVQTEGSAMSDIVMQGVYMLLCAFGSLVFAVITGYLMASLSSNFSMTIREKLFKKVENLAIQDIKKFSTSSLITRTTNDVTQIQMLIAMGLQLLIKAPITAVWAVTKILNKGWQWSAVTGVAVVILLSTIAIIMALVLPKFKIVQKLIDRVNGVTRENLTGIRVVRAFNAEKYQEDKFEGVNQNLTNLQLSNQYKFAFMQPVMYLVMYSLTLLIYFIGAYLIRDAMMVEKLTLFSNMVVFSSYAMQVIMSFLMLAVIFMLLPRADVSAKRINEVLDTDFAIDEGEFDGKTKEVGTIEFKNVSFKYPDAEEYLLENISFKANKGETVAIIGSTGSGKSTLINLIPRFYDVTDGEVLVDGVNVKDYTLEALNNKLGYVSQKAVLFQGTIRSNITYGDNGKEEVSEKKMEEALKVSQAKEFVDKLDDGVDSHVAQSGTNYSGGQKQRISIARAIARDPEIYIFDDSFSALDYKTDARLRHELKKYAHDATMVIVAQRIGTIMNADKIIVLDDGKCVGMGTHKELLKTCDVYKQIALSQVSEEELSNA